MKIYLRTFLKGFLWEALGILIMFLSCYFTKTNYQIIGWYFLIRVLLYYPFHRLFKLIKFNRVIGP